MTKPTDNPTLTDAARRMMTAMFGEEWIKGYDRAIQLDPNARWILENTASYNAAAEALQEPPALSRFSDPRIKDHLIVAISERLSLSTCYEMDGDTPVPLPSAAGSVYNAILDALGDGRMERYIELSPAWVPIAEAPEEWRDGRLLVYYAPAAEGLPAMKGSVAYHPDAGWTVDEFREVSHLCDCIPRGTP
jgi:hypothetical protein